MLKAPNPFYFFNTHKQVLIAPPNIALKTRELDDATVNNHNPSCLSVLSRTLFSWTCNLSRSSCISKIRKFLTPEATKAIIHAFVTSKIDYCNCLLFGFPDYLLQRLQRILNCAARVVYQSNKYDHITPLLMELHWLPVEQRIKFKILLITYKALNGQAPTYITDLLSYYRPARPLRSSTQNLLRNPRYNLKNYGGRSFAVAAPRLWNALPLAVKKLNSVDIFKRQLKKTPFSLFISKLLTCFYYF